MARLAEYLTRLATLFGNADKVHFLKMRKGSAVSEIHVQETAVQKVRAQLQLVAAGNASEDAARAMQSINTMLREDNASATLAVKGGGKLIYFLGCKAPLAEEAVVHEAGELIGSVLRLGGRDDTVPVLLQDADGTTYSCNTSRAVARELAHHLFGELVRVQGVGKWKRTQERAWELMDFKIKSWEPVEQTSLADSVKALRAVNGSLWNELADPHAELRKLREG